VVEGRLCRGRDVLQYLMAAAGRMSPSSWPRSLPAWAAGCLRDRSSARCGAPRLTATLGGAGPSRVMYQDQELCDVKTATHAGHGVEIKEDVIRLRRHHLDRTVLLLVALYVCWGSAIPAMKLMVDTVPPVGGAALIFLLAGVVLAGAARGRPRPTRVQLRHLAVAGVLLLVGGQGLATVALTAVTASLGAILAAAIPLWVVLLSGLTGIRVSVASWVRLVAGFGGIMIVVLTAPDSAIGGAPWAVAAFCVAPILWAAGSLLTANVDRPVDRVVASAVQLLAGGTVLLLVALSLGELDPTRWSDVSWTSAGAAVFLLIFDSLVGFMLYTRLLESAPAPLVSTYAYVTPLVGAVIGATVLHEALWAGAFAGGALVLGAVALEMRGPMRPRPSRPPDDCEPRDAGPVVTPPAVPARANGRSSGSG